MKIDLPLDDSYRGAAVIESHDYRVVFWHHQAAEPGYTQDEMGYSELTYEIKGAEDVFEVIEWAEKQAVVEDSFYCLYIKAGVDVDGGAKLVQLAGVDPTVEPRWRTFRRRRPRASRDKSDDASS